MQDILVLHIIHRLSGGGATRSLLAIAKYSSEIANIRHKVISLLPATDTAKKIADESNVLVIDAPDKIAIEKHIRDADIVQIHFWNTPEMYELLHSPLPSMRLIMWVHVGGDNAPQVVVQQLVEFSDLFLTASPHTFDLLHGQNHLSCSQKLKIGMIYDSTDFSRVDNLVKQNHHTFNIGYIGTVSLVKMHPNYISMSANINIPNVQFLVCGRGVEKYLQQLASIYGVEDRFQFLGHIENIQAVIQSLDVFGYPLCFDNYSAFDLVLQEVMYAAVPPVIFNYGGTKRIVMDGYNGIIVSSEIEYKEALEYLYYYPEERERLGNNAKAYAEQTLGARNTAKKFNQAYKGLIRQPKRMRYWRRSSPLCFEDKANPLPHGTSLFIQSLGDTSPQFLSSVKIDSLEELLAADDAIKISSPMLCESDGGIFHYRRYYLNDRYLRFWSGLILQHLHQDKQAISEFLAAIELGFPHWRIFWYIAISAKKIEDQKLLCSSLERVFQYSPDFSPARKLASQIEQPGNFLEKPIKVSVIVSIYNVEEFIDACWPNLIKQTLYLKNELEIIIFDNTSSKAEEALMYAFLKKYCSVVYINAKTQDNVQRAWKQAIEEARGIYLVSDAPHSSHFSNVNALEEMASYLDEHPDIASLYQKHSIMAITANVFHQSSYFSFSSYTYSQEKIRYSGSPTNENLLTDEKLDVQPISSFEDFLQSVWEMLKGEELRICDELEKQNNREDLRLKRLQIIEHIQSLSLKDLEIYYSSLLGKICRFYFQSDFATESLNLHEKEQYNASLLALENEESQQEHVHLIILMLLGHPFYWQGDQYLRKVPIWLLPDYVQQLLKNVPIFWESEDVNLYCRYFQRLMRTLVDLLSLKLSNDASEPYLSILEQVARTANLIPLYFTDLNLNPIYTSRSEALKLYIQHIQGANNTLSYDFPTTNSNLSGRIRIGILARHFSPQTETFAALPIFKCLNRNLFEIILFSVQATQHRLEKYCAGHSDGFLRLSNGLFSQINEIRSKNLDILFIATNLTAVTHELTLLAMHRLARIQIVDANSPVTTGMPHIDYYITSKFSEPSNNVHEHYTEKPLLLEQSPQCFDFATEEEIAPTEQITRESLGISSNHIVYASGANFYKITPEVEEVWIDILTKVSNSVLLLYPFNPNWASSYPVTKFKERMFSTLSKFGLTSNRVHILDTVPNRADVKERLKLADVYLDSFPYSGMTSLIDPLEVNLPTVVLEGRSSRSKKGASLLRTLDIPDLIATDKFSYIEIAINLGLNSELRREKRNQIQKAMNAKPIFRNSYSFGKQIESLFINIFLDYQAESLKEIFNLRKINLLLFPDWSTPEDELLGALAEVLRAIAHHPNAAQITLLIDSSGIDPEDADLALSSIAMNLMMADDAEVYENLELSLVSELSPLQWQALLSQVRGRVVLAAENEGAIAATQADQLPQFTPEGLSDAAILEV